jgi:hypothetical protein
MCCRLRFSISILRIVVFLFAFAVGVLAMLALKGLLLSEDERIELTNMVEQHETPSPTVNKGGALAIEYPITETTSEGTKAIYKATNYGSKPINFRFKGGGTSCSLNISPFPGAWRIGDSECLVSVESLNPFESTTIIAPVFDDNYGLLLSIKYTYGAAKAQNVATSFVRYHSKTNYIK